MKTKYIDTNYFLRLVLQDNLEQCLIVNNIFAEATKNKLHLYTSSLVVCECEWVLKSFYKFTKDNLIETLSKILSVRSIEFQDFDCLKVAVSNMQNNNLGLEDNYHIAYCLVKKMDFESFDKKAVAGYKKLVKKV